MVADYTPLQRYSNLEFLSEYYSPDVLLSQFQRFLFGYLFEFAAVAARFRWLEGAGVVVAVFHSDGFTGGRFEEI